MVAEKLFNGSNKERKKSRQDQHENTQDEPDSLSVNRNNCRNKDYQTGVINHDESKRQMLSDRQLHR